MNHHLLLVIIFHHKNVVDLSKLTGHMPDMYEIFLIDRCTDLKNFMLRFSYQTAEKFILTSASTFLSMEIGQPSQ